METIPRPWRHHCVLLERMLKTDKSYVSVAQLLPRFRVVPREAVRRTLSMTTIPTEMRKTMAGVTWRMYRIQTNQALTATMMWSGLSAGASSGPGRPAQLKQRRMNIQSFLKNLFQNLL